jgi:hypothetical protein
MIPQNPTPGKPEWPPPPPVRDVLRRARRRLRQGQCGDPNLDDPGSCVGLFPRRDMSTLGICGWWPLPLRARSWLASPPGRTSRVRRRVAPVVREILADELPEVIDYLTRRGR